MKISDLDSFAKSMNESKPKQRYDYKNNTLENRVKAATLKPLPESANQYYDLSISEFSAVYLHRFLSNQVKQLANQLCEPKLRPIRVEKKAIEYKLLSETLDALTPLILEIEKKDVWNEVLSDKKVSVQSLINELRANK